MKKQHKDFQEYLLNVLQDPKKALAYLNEASKDPDQRVFLLALTEVIQAQFTKNNTIFNTPPSKCVLRSFMRKSKL